MEKRICERRKRGFISVYILTLCLLILTWSVLALESAEKLHEELMEQSDVIALDNLLLQSSSLACAWFCNNIAEFAASDDFSVSADASDNPETAVPADVFEFAGSSGRYMPQATVIDLNYNSYASDYNNKALKLGYAKSAPRSVAEGIEKRYLIKTEICERGGEDSLMEVLVAVSAVKTVSGDIKIKECSAAF